MKKEQIKRRSLERRTAFYKSFGKRCGNNDERGSFQ